MNHAVNVSRKETTTAECKEVCTVHVNAPVTVKSERSLLYQITLIPTAVTIQYMGHNILKINISKSLSNLNLKK